MFAFLIAAVLLIAWTALARLRLAGWTSVTLWLAVFGGDPRHPLAAVFAGAAAGVVVRVLRAARSRQ
jgi:hypothetical protein